MANELRVRTSAPGAGKASSDIDKLRDKFDKLQKQGAKGFAIGAGAAATAKGLGLVDSALAGVIDTVGESIKKGSDLNETLSKSGVVFGDAAGAVQAFGEQSAKSLGISENAAVGAAASFGNLFVGLGLGQDKAAQMSTRLVQLAADLASFNNLDPTDVLDKLRSGLSGEAEPLRSLGVFLNESQVKAKAMEMGLADAHGELTDGAKVLARYQLILAGTTTAQGDFARTADGMANSQRRLDARLEDASAKFGQALTPAVEDAQQAIINLLDTGTGLANLLNQEVTPESLAFARAMNLIDDKTLAAGIAALREAAALKAQQAATKYMADATKDDAVPSLGRLVDATDLLRARSANLLPTLDKEKRLLQAAASAASELDSSISGLADSIYGTTVKAGDLATAQADLQEIIEKGPEGRKPGQWTAWQGEIAKARLRVLELGGELARLEGPEAFQKWLDTTRATIDKNNTEALLFLDTIERLGHLTSQLPDFPTASQGPKTGGGKKGVTAPPRPTGASPTPKPTASTGTPIRGARAAGGPVSAGMPYLVGEQGPEVVVPNANSTVLANQQSGGMGGNTYNYLTVTGTLRPMDERSIADILRRVSSLGRTPSAVIGE